MKIYSVTFKFDIDVEDEKVMIHSDEMDDDEEDYDIGDGGEAIATFQIGAIELGEAYIVAAEYIEKIMGEKNNNCEIIGINELRELNIVNWPEEDCPFCEAENAPDEDVISFTCINCGYDIKVIDGWKEISCPKCDKEIMRDKIIGNNGNYVMVNIDKDKKE